MIDRVFFFQSTQIYPSRGYLKQNLLNLSNFRNLKPPKNPQVFELLRLLLFTLSFLKVPKYTQVFVSQVIAFGFQQSAFSNPLSAF